MADAGNFIKLKVIHVDGFDLDVDMARNACMGKLFNTFAERKGVDQDSLRFVYVGQQIYYLDTATSLKMANGDVIQVFNNNEANTNSDEIGAKDLDHVKLKLVDDALNEVQFRVNKTDLMGKLKDSYAEHKKIDAASLSMMFNMKQIKDDDTADSLKLKDDDVIDVFDNY